MNSILHEVAITAIISKEGKFLISDRRKESRRKRAEFSEARLYLIIRRSKNKKRFPSMWTVPGGKLETSDYTSLPKNTKDYWYNVLEKTLSREVMEEVGIKVNNVQYLTSLATVHKDGAPSLVISCTADYQSGKIKLQQEESDDFAWVSLKEAKQSLRPNGLKKYDLIDGIYDELVMAEKKLKGLFAGKAGKKVIWKRF